MAVLEGYELGDLPWLGGHYYVFTEGRQIAGPWPMLGFDPQEVVRSMCPFIRIRARAGHAVSMSTDGLTKILLT